MLDLGRALVPRYLSRSGCVALTGPDYVILGPQDVFETGGGICVMGTSGRIRHETYVQVGGALEVMQKDGQRSEAEA